MRYLLQFGVLLLGLASVFTPFLEYLDRWDPPGPPMNDTELGVFGFVLVLCLILLVSKLLATLDRLVEIGVVFRQQSSRAVFARTGESLVFVVEPHSSPPLRI